MTLISRCCAALLALLLMGPALAQAPVASAQAAAESTQEAPDINIADLRARFSKLPASADDNDGLRALLAQINAIAAQVDAFINARTAPLADLNARLGELGAAPAAPGTEDPSITRQRAALTKQRNALDSDIRLAKLLAIDARQRGTDLVNQRRKLFEAQLTERASSPLGGAFWLDIRDAWPDDISRLRALWDEMRRGAAVASEPQHRTKVLLTFVAALLVAVLGNLLAESALLRLATRLLPPGRLRRSLLVIAFVGANVLLVGASAQWLASVLDDNGALGEQTRKVAQAVVAASIFISFVVGLGRALLSVKRPSWRLPPMSDDMARRLAPYPWLIGLIGAMVWAPAQVNAVIDASFAAVLATHVITALALTALIAAIVLRLGPDAAPPPAPPGATTADAPVPVDRPIWVGVLLSAVMVVIVVIWVLVAIGFVALASFLAGQLTWGGIVAAASYVMFKFSDDLFTAVVSSKSRFGVRLQKSFGFAPQTLDQAAVLLSGVSRVAVFFYMLIALMAPLGSGPGEVFQRSGKFGSGFKVGEFELVPGAIFSALGVAVAGFIAVRVLKRWLSQRYLPSTSLEPGMQSSISTLLGYVGSVLVVAFAMSALGIGVNRIAWVASALSVGIGFGLQAIVQNFISGLILLAERPVKVGDWVVLGTSEGDVRRINVRATEIQLGDRSTLIVPNSEFITKIVRNMTLANAEGRVLIRLPMPLSTDAKKVRALMLAACNTHSEVLPTPSPSVTLEGVEGGALIFQAIAFVASPRLAGGVRSDLMFEILDALRTADLPLSVPTMMVASGAATPMATPAEGPPPPAQT
ncbi:DUF3772 domain-containing protein [Variovorax sp. dw_954]|uniref:DUF3772 domain-containing protein n=1 Tax=Variovorax sp. dw_954 TaxID=2720078 RepID=UPI001BD5BB22|nr:DUF3772 domain-containing protein [Variovorax sp. dw_954]